MPFNLNAIPDEQNVREAIQLGEGPQIELREKISSALDLGKLVSGFANATGGWIIIGVREPNTIVGTETARLGQFFDRVNDRIQPAQNLMMYPVTLDGRPVRVVVVKPSQVLVVTDAGAFIRDGEHTRAMSADEIRARAVAAVPPAEDAAAGIARLTGTIVALMEKFDASQTWRAQWRNLLVGTVGSTLSTIIVALVIFFVGVAVTLLFKH
jgi:hypothetical protein